MPNANRTRGSFGDRSPGLIDLNTVGSPLLAFTNKFSLNSNNNTDGAVVGPTMETAAVNAGITWSDVLTVALWFKFDDTGPQSQPDGFDGLCNASNTWSLLSEGWSMYWNNSANAIICFTDTFSDAVTGTTVADFNVWNFFAFTWNVNNTSGQRMKVYTNGNNFNQGGTSATGFTDDLTNNIEVGKTANVMGGSGVTDFTPGFYKEFGVWNAELSGAEIESLYNSGNGLTDTKNYGRNFDNYTNANNLVLWWRLGDGQDQVDVSNGIRDEADYGNHGTSSDMTKAEDIPGA